jgi:hypothetical protein
VDASCLSAYEEGLSDLSIRIAQGHQPEHLVLTCSESKATLVTVGGDFPYWVIGTRVDPQVGSARKNLDLVVKRLGAQFHRRHPGSG